VSARPVRFEQLRRIRDEEIARRGEAEYLVAEFEKMATHNHFFRPFGLSACL